VDNTYFLVLFKAQQLAYIGFTTKDRARKGGGEGGSILHRDGLQRREGGREGGLSSQHDTYQSLTHISHHNKGGREGGREGRVIFAKTNSRVMNAASRCAFISAELKNDLLKKEPPH